MKKNVKHAAAIIMAIMSMVFCLCLVGCSPNYKETSDTLTHTESAEEANAPATFKRIGDVGGALGADWIYYVDTQTGVVYAEHCAGAGQSSTRSMTVIYNTDGTPKILPEYARGYDNMTAQE